jgi:hypothetical protein
MIPHGVSPKVCSACWHLKALVTPVTVPRPNNFSRKVAKATSRAAELDKPLPRGTLEQITASNDAPEGRSERYWKIVPFEDQRRREEEEGRTLM